MAVEALKSSSLTNADATPLVKNNARLAAAAMRGAIGFATADAVASIGSTYRLLRVPSKAGRSRFGRPWAFLPNRWWDFALLLPRPGANPPAGRIARLRLFSGS